MTILFIGLGQKIPTFIFRRIVQLDAAGVSTILYLQPHQQRHFQTLKQARFVVYPRRSSQDWGLWVKLTLSTLLNFGKACLLWTKAPIKRPLARLRWVIEKMPLATLKKHPDVVHLQWIGMASEYNWLKERYECPLIASARGSQVTVYPATDSTYRQNIKKNFDSVDYIHCVSKDIARHCEKLGASKTQLFVNYNGIDLNEFCPNLNGPKNTENQPFKLITVGTLMWRKGYYYQLIVLKKLLDKKLPCELIIIGSGAELQGLKYTAQQLNISDQVNFTGQISTDEVRHLLQTSDLYLSTSVAEGLCNSVMEAAACGLPAVVFDCEGMAELIAQNVSGYILPFGDLDGMVEAIASLLDNAGLRASMATAARNKIEASFDANYWSTKMIEQYHNFTKTHA